MTAKLYSTTRLSSGAVTSNSLAAVSDTAGRVQPWGGIYLSAPMPSGRAFSRNASCQGSATASTATSMPRGSQLTARDRAVAAWLWSGKEAVVAGNSAAAVHGAQWVDADAPAELISDRMRPPPLIVTRNETFAPDEHTVVAGIPVTTPARTAFDLGRREDLRRGPTPRCARACNGYQRRRCRAADGGPPWCPRYEAIAAGSTTDGRRRRVTSGNGDSASAGRRWPAETPDTDRRPRRMGRHRGPRRHGLERMACGCGV